MIEVDSLVRQGIVYPRWFPDFGQGHGYPIFNFFPPFAYLLTEVPALLLPGLPLAIQVSMAAAVLVSGWGMYVLAREIAAGRQAAMAAAGFYVYFPYHIQDTYTRGGMPELWAMAWLPWLAWAQLRATREPSPGCVGLAGLLAATEIGTHNIMAVFILPATLALSIVFTPLKRRFVMWSLGCSALGVLLATGYWLPAVVEAPLTHVRQLAGDWLPDHLFPPARLIQPGFFAEYGDKVYKLNALEAGIIAALVATLLWQGWRRRRWLPEGGLVALMLALVFLLTSSSTPFWLNVPLLGYIQFPWRLLAIIGFVAAVMLAAAARRRFAWIGVAAVAVVTAFSSLGTVPNARFAPTPPFDARVLQAQEYGSALDGVAIESEYQPQTSNPDLMKASQGRRLPADTTSAPPLSIASVSTTPSGLQTVVDAPRETVLRLESLFWPGWQAQLDGGAWPIRPATPAGFMEAEIPPGRHTLTVEYGGTPVETAGGLISGLVALGVAIWVLRRRRVSLVLAAMALAAISWLLWRPPEAQTAIRPVSWATSADQTLVAAGQPRVTARGLEVDLWWLFASPRETAFEFVLKDGTGRPAGRVPAGEAAAMPYEYIAANELLERHYALTGLQLPAGTYELSLDGPMGATPLGQVTLLNSRPAPTSLNAAFQEQVTLRGYTVERVSPRPG
ncbi:MAG TPA: 6-pyruvoyl-tetrahydropterin synthase-related protein, partial [Chloroflexota bacterium]